MSAGQAPESLPAAKRPGTKLIIDSDNTIGVPRRDIDDGLTLLYLLGRDDIDIIGITTTFGNSDIDTVNANTRRFLKEIGREAIPVHHGARAGEDRRSDAARFLVSAARQYPGEVTLLALGSLANLAGAAQIDPAFFTNVASIVVMGGVTEPLMIGGNELSELNFAVDSEAARRVLHSSTLPAVLTGNLCKNAFFGPDDFERLAEGAKRNAALRLVQRYALPWRAWRNERQPTDGFFLWDLVPAVYLTNPELFETSQVRLATDETNLDRGFIEEAPPSGPGSAILVGMRIRDVDALKTKLFDAWRRVSLKSVSGISDWAALPRAAMPRGVSHINVVVDDIEQASDFYRDVLGFEQATYVGGKMDYPNYTSSAFARNAGLPNGVVKVHIRWLRHPEIGLNLELARYEQPEGVSQPAVRRVYDAGGLGHIAVDVEDARVAYEHILAKRNEWRTRGLEMEVFAEEHEPERLPYPVRFFYWRDPFGLVWEMEDGRRVEKNIAGVVN